MIGALLGDMIGAPYEFDRGDKTKDFPLFCQDSHFTDDSVMTIAVAEALMSSMHQSDEMIKTLLVTYMRKWGHMYPDAGYGLRFIRWLESPNPKPYRSYGNGSAMRVSSAGWLFNTLEETRHVARLTAEVSHNHLEGIRGAEATASAIFLARTGHTKEEIRDYIVYEFNYNLSRTCDEIRPTYHHVESCQETVPEAITAFLEGTDFEDVIRTAVSLGGDCDTLTCIAGSIAEAFYGVPDDIRDECLRRLPEGMKAVISSFEKMACGRIEKQEYFKANPHESEDFFSDGCLDAREPLEENYGDSNPLEQMREEEAPGNEVVCMWKSADVFARHELQRMGFQIEQDALSEKHICYLGALESEPCILYLFLQKNKFKGTVFKSVLRLKDDPISQGRRILILYVRMVPVTPFSESSIPVCGYSALHNADGRHWPDMWTIETAGNRDVLLYASRWKDSALIDRFIAAYNAKDYDLLCSLIHPDAREKILKSTWIGADLDDLRQFFDALYHLGGKLRAGYISNGQEEYSKMICWEYNMFAFLAFDRDGRVTAIYFRKQKEYERRLFVVDSCL